jgi:hypothetical protein
MAGFDELSHERRHDADIFLFSPHIAAGWLHYFV